MKIFLTISFLLTFLLVFASCSSKPPKENPGIGKNPEVAKAAPPLKTPSMEAKQLASEEETGLVTEFDFKKGSEMLTHESKMKLKELGEKALARGTIEVIKVISWSDKEYPGKKKKLSDMEVSLAKNRNTEIKKYLTSLDQKKQIEKIELISMAERPAFFNRLLSSDDYKVKRSLETAGIPDSDSKKISTNKKASRSIVLIIMKNQHR